MRNRSKNIISGVSIVMAVLITAIIVILLSVLSKNDKAEGVTTQVKNSKNQVESTLDSTLDANTSTSKADETIATNGDENGSSLIENSTEKNGSLDFTNNSGEGTSKENTRNTTNQINTKNPNNNTQSNSQNNTQGSTQTTTQKNTSKTTSAYNPSVNTTTAKENTTGNQKSFKCYIGIYCKTILNNMDNLKSSKKQYVPANGVILEKLEVTVYENETVFDVLKRVCKQKGIQMEYTGGTVFQTAYVKGINNLYEFDCGRLSGWKYCVNGEYPSFGCDQYVLKSNDVIEWNYTCTMDDL